MINLKVLNDIDMTSVWTSDSRLIKFQTDNNLTVNESIAITLRYRKGYDIDYWKKSISETNKSMMYADSYQAMENEKRDVKRYFDYITALNKFNEVINYDQ